MLDIYVLLPVITDCVRGEPLFVLAANFSVTGDKKGPCAQGLTVRIIQYEFSFWHSCCLKNLQT